MTERRKASFQEKLRACELGYSGKEKLARRLASAELKCDDGDVELKEFLRPTTVAEDEQKPILTQFYGTVSFWLVGSIVRCPKCLTNPESLQNRCEFLFL